MKSAVTSIAASAPTIATTDAPGVSLAAPGSSTSTGPPATRTVPSSVPLDPLNPATTADPPDATPTSSTDAPVQRATRVVDEQQGQHSPQAIPSISNGISRRDVTATTQATPSTAPRTPSARKTMARRPMTAVLSSLRDSLAPSIAVLTVSNTQAATSSVASASDGFDQLPTDNIADGIDKILDGLNVGTPIPGWIQKMVNHFTEVDLGVFWVALLCSWVMFEWKGGHWNIENPARTQIKVTTSRSAEVAAWIKWGRKLDRVHVWTDEAFGVFRSDFSKWWELLQPSNRSVFVTSPDFTGDWSILRRRGRNGVMMIVLCLFWWGSKSQDTVWRKHVQDLQWCLDAMVSSPDDTVASGSSSKRSANNDPETEAAPQRKRSRT
ncbi:hypothetical protein NLI96_g12425 [Meripilus lineatus]|uniref:Uncharacterized protein n=1 Tax=Meripilus lineatus TaxID=2056292 RepID=A0AAD5UPY5_9APHY|nr:hypothetical protein NLI96_g12425 [Physisporinus lineatus]